MAADTTENLPRHLAPLPRKIETVALRYASVIVAIKLTGTPFCFRYYIPQFRLEPVLAWPVVPDSPTATFFIACSLALYKLGRSNEYPNMLLTSRGRGPVAPGPPTVGEPVASSPAAATDRHGRPRLAVRA